MMSKSVDSNGSIRGEGDRELSDGEEEEEEESEYNQRGGGVGDTYSKEQNY